MQNSATELLANKAITWWPDQFMDEIIPPARSHPNDYIVKTGDGFQLHDGDEGQHNIELKHCDVHGFTGHLFLGKATLSWRQRGLWSIDTPMPAEADECRWNGNGMASDTIANLASYFDDMGEAGDYVIEYRSYPMIEMRFNATTAAFEPLPETA